MTTVLLSIIAATLVAILLKLDNILGHFLEMKVDLEERRRNQ